MAVRIPCLSFLVGLAENILGIQWKKAKRLGRFLFLTAWDILVMENVETLGMQTVLHSRGEKRTLVLK